jgi:phosphopantothenoylcysteine synthetase/decarboxylase
VNDISRPDIGFDSDQNEVAILSPGGDLHVPRSSKEEIAVRVLDFVQNLRAAARPGERRRT